MPCSPESIVRPRKWLGAAGSKAQRGPQRATKRHKAVESLFGSGIDGIADWELQILARRST